MTGKQENYSGILADELGQLLPNYVTTEKQGDGEDVQMVDYSRLVPFLIGAVQELTARVIQLEKNKEK